MDEDTPIRMTALDKIAGGSNLQMIKALLPYIDYPKQRMMALFIKSMEISNILSFYNHPADMAASSIKEPPPPVSMREMMQDIVSYMNGPEQGMIEQFLNIMEMMEMMQTFQNMDNGNTDEMLKNLLSPEQQAMFEAYQTMM